jgi:hypothetical protein
MSRKQPISGAARERLRRQAQAAREQETSRPPGAMSRREAATTCGWCDGAIDVRPTGRIPKWCSQSCRQRAWEQKRAAESGRSAVTIVERVVAVPAPAAPRRRDWPARLAELAHDLDRGRIYPRDLPGLSRALDQVLTANAEPPADRPIRPHLLHPRVLHLGCALSS